jgi:CRISPR system Cascade subunit CasE
MFLSKLTYKTKKPFSRSELYKYHQEIWNLFSKAGKFVEGDRDFLFSEYNDEILVLSPRRPAYLTTSPFDVLTKEFNPVFESGQYLTFDLHLNAEKRLRNGKRKNIISAYVDELQRRNFEFNWDQACYEAAREWLDDKSRKKGFIVHDFQVMRIINDEFQNSRNKKVFIHGLHLHGVLEITDPELFTQNYIKGIGKSKAFGYGMLLLAPYRKNG